MTENSAQIISLIVAQDQQGAIGFENKMPWHIPEDFAFFKAYTMGKPVVMGRKTWQSLPKKPLQGRDNVVISRNTNFEVPGAVLFNDIPSALSAYQQAPEICIIGGAEIYRQCFAMATDIRVTAVAVTLAAADSFFPKIALNEWRRVSAEAKTSVKGLDFTWEHYQRI